MDRIQELQTVIAKSELAQTDVDELIADFGEAVEAAAQWEEQAKSLEVTSEDQTDLMQKARMARLELREKRLAVTKKHKELKQSSLRRGQALDGIKRFALELIEPTEKWLQAQEDFVKIKREREEQERREKAEALLREQEEKERQRREEAERKAMERREAERQEELRIAREKAEQEAAERRKAQEKAEAERVRAREEIRKVKEESERKVREAQESIRRKADAAAKDIKKQRIVDIVFAGDAGNLFYEDIQNGEGESIRFGEWIRREDGKLVLRVRGGE